MTSLSYFADLLADGPRVAAFHRAIAAAVEPGDRVLEVGTGLGTYAFFAARAGAGKVWAVEREPVIHVARQLAVANRVADRVEMVRGDAATLELPDRVDVLIFEDFPVWLLDRATWELLQRVQSALADGGRMVPRGARLRVAPVRAPELYRKMFPGPGSADGAADLDWSALRLLLANCPRQEMLRPEHLLAPPLDSEAFALWPLPTPDAMAVEGAWRATSDGSVHALALWFDLEVGPGVWMSNEPAPSPGVWGQAVLPLDPPLHVAEGQPVEVSVGRETLAPGAPGWLTWSVTCDGETRRGHEFAGLAVDVEGITDRPREPHQPADAAGHASFDAV